MDWVKDKNGRFPRRPFYSIEELESRCEGAVIAFLDRRQTAKRFPISTDNLTVLIETMVADLDLFADLTGEGEDVEGVTDFFPGLLPRVRISRALSEDPRLSNRLRTTLTHELGHVIFHELLFSGPVSGSLFDAGPVAVSNKCKRDRIVGAPMADWMEWQAGFACGALLMPQGALSEAIRRIGDELGLSSGKPSVSSAQGRALIEKIATTFEVSRDAARVRLCQRDALVGATNSGALFG